MGHLTMALGSTITRWKEPALSGLVLGSGLVLLLALSSYSLISVVAYLGLSLVLVGLGAQLYVHLMGLLKKPCKDPLACLAALANTLALVTLFWILAFTLPTIYDAKKKEIDGAVAAAMEHYTSLNAKVAALLPATPAAKQE